MSTTGDKIVNIALKYLNKAMGATITKAYGGFKSGVPEWCVMFVWYVFREAGKSNLVCDGKKFCATTTIDEYCRHHYRHISLAEASAGDIVLFTWNGVGGNCQRGSRDHIGIVIKSLGNSSIQTVEGNCGNAVNTKSKVKKKTRYLNQIYAVYQMPYNDDIGVPVDELAKDVLKGKYGSGNARKKALGNRYQEVQNRVNYICYLTDKVMKGDYGTGEERKKALGSDYDIVQWNINRIYNERK